MVMPKLEPGTEGDTVVIPFSAITGDPTHTQLVTLNAQGQVTHVSAVINISAWVHSLLSWLIKYISVCLER